ncbi:MAG TPA: tRNA (adenosine(37)-N6)-threonylcarbamoyltransferase complex dimerization subunit type 1 TsaB [Dongiaceae bacterium]|nr:tRNA (adenosine(37)-N6)-threonylcarbamoyltransferase complex dimerization subunit type 1 TsaB [Dongiaceae bacterium]
MIILAIDTSEQRGSVAVLRDGDTLAVEAHTGATDYSEWLIPGVEGVLASAEVRMEAVDLFAVATGPGSFTGVRVGLTTVKAWCEVYGKPVVGVSRLEALARLAGCNGGLVGAYYDAQRGQIFAAIYRAEDAKIGRIGDETVIAPQEFLEVVEREAGQEPVQWVTMDGELIAELEGWQKRVDKGDRIQSVSAELAPAIGRSAHERALAGQFTDPLELDANYVRRSDAEIFWKGPAAHGR